LAAYADIKANRSARVLALGSDPILGLLCEDMDEVYFADDPSQVASELAHQFDLCIHSSWIETYPPGPESALKAIDGLLSPLGRQIFSTNLSATRWRTVKHPLTSEALMKWLRKKGKYQTSSFDPDLAFGKGAASVFGCDGPESLETVLIVSKSASAVSK